MSQPSDGQRAPDARRIRAFLDLGRVDRAMSETRALLAADPTDPEGLELLSLCLIRLGQYHEARAVLADALGQTPDAAHLHYLVGYSAWRERDVAAAEAGFSEALRLDAREAVYLRAAAEFYAGRKRYEEAMQLARRAVEADASRSSNHRTLGFVASASGQLDLAWTAYRKAIELDPEDGDAWNNLGCVAFARGDRLKAREYFREALRLDPHGERSQVNLKLVVPPARPHAIYDDFDSFLGEVLRDLTEAGKPAGPLRTLAIVQAVGQAAVTRALTTRLESKGTFGRLGVVAGRAVAQAALRRLVPSTMRTWALTGAAASVGWMATVRWVTPMRRRFVEQVFAARREWEEGRKAWLEGTVTRAAREASVARLVERLAVMLAHDTALESSETGRPSDPTGAPEPPESVDSGRFKRSEHPPDRPDPKAPVGPGG